MESGEPVASRSVSEGELIISCQPWVWAFGSAGYKKRCANCFQSRDTLSRCSRCKVHGYCDEDCQKQDWDREHKTECRMLQGVAASIEASNGFNSEEESCMPGTLLLVAKIANKIKRNALCDLPGRGSMTAQQVLDMFPTNPASNSDVSMGGWSLLGQKLQTPVLTMLEYLKLVRHEAFPIRAAEDVCVGIALFPTVRYRAMTPVCSDVSVTMCMTWRSLMVYATEDIPHYSGLQDLRCNVLNFHPFLMSSMQRRACFQQRNGQSCTCRKCTPEYEADMNLMYCITPGCSQRIPSDLRALKPCPKCGATNNAQLVKFRHLMDTYDAIWRGGLAPADQVEPKGKLFEEIEAAGVLYPDAHLRYICGFPGHSARLFTDFTRFDADWTLLQEMVACLRKVHPKLDLTRATNLLGAAFDVMRFLLKAVQGADPTQPASESGRAAALMSTVRPVANSWYREACDIYDKLLGPGSHAGRSDIMLGMFEMDVLYGL
ncbi:SET and MYND domain-containing protein DDB_G0277331-like [Paramacrobiotus metropolitanus]|uniref:SET and MYND domain-containing protein DDB_G0277331-like n=1 Tax=Paramacrobiotus metropolitanus TaxID=2943436 RepID=UPI002445D314|nr:SET and MYND domain-containing protein DDB_G0277331-like [Paramacrobiotus metropolitanus]